MVLVCFAAVISSPAMGEMVANGDFETLKVSGHFLDWYYNGTTVDEVSSSPSVISDTYSARLKHGTGLLSQTISSEGLSNFELEFDFAVLDNAGRSLSVSSDGNIANFKVDSGAISVWYRYPSGASGWHSTGLAVNTTPDIDSDGYWDDGEVPVVNHLTLVGTDYGTANAALTIELTGGAANGTYSSWVLPTTAQSSEYKKLVFNGNYAGVDFMVDNVSCEVPEPSTFVLLAFVLSGLLACAWKKRK